MHLNSLTSCWTGTGRCVPSFIPPADFDPLKHSLPLLTGRRYYKIPCQTWLMDVSNTWPASETSKSFVPTAPRQCLQVLYMLLVHFNTSLLCMYFLHSWQNSVVSRATLLVLASVLDDVCSAVTETGDIKPRGSWVKVILCIYSFHISQSPYYCSATCQTDKAVLIFMFIFVQSVELLPFTIITMSSRNVFSSDMLITHNTTSSKACL